MSLERSKLERMDGYERIVVGVVLFHPTEQAWRLVEWLVGTGVLVWVVDNSACAVEAPVVGIGGYWHHANRHGLAGALNLLGNEAAQRGMDWLLTLDQDSQFQSEADFYRLLQHALQADAKIGALAPTLLYPFAVSAYSRSPAMQSRLRVMTSGMILRMQAWRQCGPYREDYFIDSLDNEYCLRLHAAHWDIRECGDVALVHEIGATRRHRSLCKGHDRDVSHHSALRRYYIARNRLVTMWSYRREFPDFYREEARNFLGDMAKIVLYEENKLRKFVMTLWGVVDAFAGEMGPWRPAPCHLLAVRMTKRLVRLMVQRAP